MDGIAIDLLKVDQPNGYEYMFLIVDHFTIDVQAYSTKKKISKLLIAERLFRDLILNFGTPNRILHDQGKEYGNKLFDELQSFLGIKVEQHGGEIKPNIHSDALYLTEKLKRKWKDSINKPKFAFNSTRHSATGFNPHFCYQKRNLIYQLTSSYDNTMINLMESRLITKCTHNNGKIKGQRLSKLQMIAQRRLDMPTKRQKDQKGTFKPREVARKFLSGI